MKYLINAIRFTRAQPSPTLLYLFISLFIMSVFILLSVHEESEASGALLMICSILIMLYAGYLLIGMRSCVWKAYCGERFSFNYVRPESGKYFWITIKVVVCMILIGLILDIVLRFFIFPFLNAFSTFLTRFILNTLFLYTLPFIYVFDKRTISVVGESIEFLKDNLAVSKELILFVAFITLLGVVIKLAVPFNYNSITTWSVYLVSNLISSYLQLIIFLAAAHIVSLSNEDEAEDQA
jgi:hypothetical protein